MNVFRRYKQELMARLPDREIYMRSEGRVRFLKISSKFQMNFVIAVGSAVLGTLIVLASTAIVTIGIASERDELSEHAEALRHSEQRIDTYRSSVAEFAAELTRRQRRLEDIVKRRFGTVEIKDGGKKSTADLRKLPPEAQFLAEADHRQRVFAVSLTRSVEQRITTAQTALGKVGVRIPNAKRSQMQGMGGPYIPADETDAQLDQLSSSLDRLNRLNSVLLATPSSIPARPARLSSRFGRREDPFNRRPAMHAGLDFRGRHGQPIYAAADGRVVSVGRMGGYGNIVVIRHGQGFETRYGHLSGFAVKSGARVRAGQKIARMGSTGRSTGNHLHFEVLLNGRAVNPMPYISNASQLSMAKKQVRDHLASL